MFTISSPARDQSKIEFRDVNNWEEVFAIHSVAPRQPYRMCSTSSTFLYVDASKTQYEVFRVHFHAKQLQSTSANAKMEQFAIYDMCCAYYIQKVFLIVTRGHDGIYCYNLNTGNVEWSTSGRPSGISQQMKLSGVTTDGRGHLFVCDGGNSCIQMFSVSDGKHLGALLKAGEEELGTPHLIRWCSRSSSLIVTQRSGRLNCWCLNVVFVRALPDFM